MASFSSHQATIEIRIYTSAISTSTISIIANLTIVQIKKASANAATEPRRIRKVIFKTERPQWVTLVRIFSTNLVLLIVILGLVQMIRKLALKSANSLGGSLVVVPDFEQWIAEVESFVKSTTNMMQV